MWFFFLLLALHGAYGIYSLPPTDSVQCDNFFLILCKTRCINLFLNCSSLGGFWSALLYSNLGLSLGSKETSSEYVRDPGDDAFEFLSELARILFWCLNLNLRCSWARKSDRPYGDIYCEMSRSFSKDIPDFVKECLC